MSARKVATDALATSVLIFRLGMARNLAAN